MTTNELHAEIETAKQRLQAAEARSREIEEEIQQATERQHLRRELEQIQQKLHDRTEMNQADEAYTRDIDADEDGDFLSFTSSGQAVPQHPKKSSVHTVADADMCTNFGHQILKGEFRWRLLSMSWLQTALCQESRPFAESALCWIDRLPFKFVYNPSGGPLGTSTDGKKTICGSLAIRSFAALEQQEPFALRYSIYVRRNNGDFVQWGSTRDDINTSLLYCGNHGPDVHPQGSPPEAIGIFGLTHEQLLQSEWVHDDTLTLKFVLEVRCRGITHADLVAVDVPEPSLHRDAQALFEEASSSDVRFRVEDQVIHAHSQVLCARSEVLKKQLNSGMQESKSKVIVIEDCVAATFKAFLKFLYTDTLPTVADLAEEPSSQTLKEDGSRHPSQMEALWAVSHKYQVERLQRWCEAQLCNQLSAERVCSVLRQAHVFEATQLEKVCLAYIKDNFAEVLKLQAYSDLMSKWPEVALKVQLFSTGVPESEAAAIVQARKVRKLEDGVVDSELERRAERKEVSGEDEDDHSKEIEIKPTMEELSEKYGMARARLDFFHDLFQSFLPPNKDGSPGICGYPENPATLNKKTMFLMLKEINPSLQEAEFEARFRRIDGDGSGLIEFDEFVQWVYDDEVEVVGGAEKVKRTFEELAGDMDVSIRLIEYCYDCFKEELDSGTVDNYPTECATLPKEQACTLAQILVTTLDKKRFDRYWDTVDVQNKGAVTFDDFLELLDFEDMPEDVLAKYNDNED
ncbi:BPM6 [Symbiodinium sp. CCMP2456]|nr:BPM6 [Symbiodinium sp. CCMP2456]